MHYRQHAFTLIELSIVLIIIGLIIGGVLVGRDMIKSAEIRSTIQQIEKYNTAVNTFRSKYGGLPGDLTAQKAASYGMVARAGIAGRGDGNGLIEGCSSNSSEGGCENALFWRDLSFAGLIDGSFSSATDGFVTANLTDGTLALYFPTAKIGRGNFIVAYTGMNGGADGLNHYEIVGLVGVGVGTWNTRRWVTPYEAFSIDSKIDDGLPLTGTTIAVFDFSELGYIDSPDTPAAGVCVSDAATPNPYNTGTSDYANSPACQLSVRFN